MSRFSIHMVIVLVVAVLGRLLLDLSVWQSFIFAAVATPLGYILFAVQSLWWKREARRFADEVQDPR